MRFIATGGVLKGILKTDDEITNEDMIHINGDDLEQSEDTGERIGFSYMASVPQICLQPEIKRVRRTMISYVILTDNQMAETKDKDEAARTCLRVGVPHFYEVDSSDPMTPTLVWQVQKSGDSYILKSESWKELVEKHDR